MRRALQRARSYGTVLLLLLLCCWAAASAARIVAVGDCHGDLPNTLRVLRAAGVVAGGAGAGGGGPVVWTGGTDVLVQTGDLFDRGPDSLALVELFRALAGGAAAAGGRVVCLIGNHELMNLQGDLRYVEDGDAAQFGGWDARAAALSPRGAVGQWLRSLDAAAVIDGVLFSHAGVVGAAAERGVAAVNAAMRRAIGSDRPFVSPSSAPDRYVIDVVWGRSLAERDEGRVCAALDAALVHLGRSVEAMVVGHTPQLATGRPWRRCGGRLVLNDVGISSYYGGNIAASEFTRDANGVLQWREVTEASASAPAPAPAAAVGTPAAGAAAASHDL